MTWYEFRFSAAAHLNSEESTRVCPVILPLSSAAEQERPSPPQRPGPVRLVNPWTIPRLKHETLKDANSHKKTVYFK